METVTTDSYNPHALVTLKKITSFESGDVQYELYKATELESIIEDATRRTNLIEQRIEAQEKQLGQIINNLTVDGWYSNNIDKDDVLRDLCEILGYEPTATLNWSVTVSVSGTTEVPLAEVEDFDLRYHLDDNSWHISDEDSLDWD
jgi:hypothetical protein